ncbi:MAG TPA: MFS transporter [Polyangia bacterium]|nr:MFS transporter [Polyangia bacterium]
MTRPPRRALFAGDHGRFLASITTTSFAIQVQNTAVGYQMYRLTGDPLALGMVGLAEALPFIALALGGGLVADRVDRRRIALAALTTMAAGALALVGLARSEGTLGRPAVRLAIYALIAVGGVCRSFLQPARTALAAQLAPAGLHAQAVAWRTGLFQLASAVGPALGGLMCAVLGVEGAYGLAAGLLLCAVLLMGRVRTPVTAARAPARSLRASVEEGFSFLRSDRVLLPAFLLDLFAVLFGGATALLPVFASDVLRVGPRGFGLLRAAPAVGALVASAMLALRPPLRRAGRALLVSVAGFGVAIVIFALSRSFALSLLMLALSGGLDMVSVLVRSTLLQLRVPEHMLGRVASINQIFIGSSNEIGAFESGLAARLLGTVPSVVLGGAVTLAVVGVAAWRAPHLRRLGPLVPEQQSPVNHQT